MEIYAYKIRKDIFDMSENADIILDIYASERKKQFTELYDEMISVLKNTEFSDYDMTYNKYINKLSNLLNSNSRVYKILGFNSDRNAVMFPKTAEQLEACRKNIMESYALKHNCYFHNMYFLYYYFKHRIDNATRLCIVKKDDLVDLLNRCETIMDIERQSKGQKDMTYTYERYMPSSEPDEYRHYNQKIRTAHQYLKKLNNITKQDDVVILRFKK